MKTKMKTVIFCIMLIVIMAYQPVCFGVDINLSLKAQILGVEVRPGDSRITGVGLSPDGSNLYAAYWTDSSSDPIGVYSTSNYTLLPPMLSYGRCHSDVVTSNDGRYVYAPSYYEGNVSRFDRNNGNARTDLSAGEWTAGSISKSPDGTKLVAYSGMDGRSYDMGNDRVYVYNISGGAFSTIDSVPLPDEPRGQKNVFSNDGQYVYVPTYQRQSSAARLYEVSISGTLGINRYLEFPGNGLQSVAGNFNTVFVSDNDNKKIWMVDKATWSITDSIDLSYQPFAIVMHPDGQNLFVAGNGTVSVFDITTKSLVSSLTDIQRNVTDIELNQNGSLAYASFIFPGGVEGSIYGGIAVINTPEPATLLLLGLGGLLLRKRSKA